MKKGRCLVCLKQNHKARECQSSLVVLHVEDDITSVFVVDLQLVTLIHLRPHRDRERRNLAQNL